MRTAARPVRPCPYDVPALAARFGVPWGRLYNRSPHLFDMPKPGYDHLIELGNLRVGVLLQNWRNAR